MDGLTLITLTMSSSYHLELKKRGKVVSDFRSKASNGDSKLSNVRSKLSDAHTKLCVNTHDSLLRTYLKLSYDSYSTAVQIVTDYPVHSMSL